MNKKNVIILMIDGGRLDYAQSSKIFSKLKSNSVFLSQSITYAPHTIAAMHAVFSGTYGNRTGTNSYWSTFQFKKEKFKTLTEYLRDENYYTYADVINQLVIPKQGFDEFIVHDEDNDDLVQRHKNILQNIKEKLNKKNFFLYLHYSNIHTGIKNEVLNKFHNHSEKFFNDKEKNEKRYKNLFGKAENYIEGILNEIKNLEFKDNSLIIIMSDHGVSQGEKFGEHAYGAFCYDYTLRTFTYFLTTDFSPIEIKQQTRTIDFMPTILDILDIKLDNKFEKLDGCSLTPLFNGEKFEEEIAFTETGNPLHEKKPPKEPNTCSIRTSNWKLIHNLHNNTKELYNLEIDADENNNLINTGLDIEKKLVNELDKIREKSN